MSAPPPPPPPGGYPFLFPPPHQPGAPMVDPNLALYQPFMQPGHPPPPAPPMSHATPMSESSIESPNEAGSSKATGKRPAPGKDADVARKKVKTDDGVEDGEDGGPKEKVKATRGSRACTVCRRLKMKCVGAENGPPCKRCETGGHECIFEESNRGKRSTKKSEALQRSLNKMEKTLDIVLRSIGNPSLQNLAENLQSGSRSPSPVGDSPALAQNTANLMSPSPSTQTPDQRQTLRSESSLSNRPHSAVPKFPTSPKLDSLPDSTLNPLGLLADTSLAHRREKISSATEDEAMRKLMPQGDKLAMSPEPGNTQIGLANDRYFKPGPMNILPLRRLYIERQIQPEMLTFVTKEEVMDLFKIYFEFMNLHCSMLDPTWHTPSLVCSRSPFLLTAICAVSSKFYAARPDLHQRLNKIVKKLAFSVPEQGFKSVEIVQAYLIIALWGTGPVERFEQERTWIYLGLAIRTATDINLHRQIPYANDDTPESRATNMEIRNRERAWLLCYVLDRSFSSQMGKPHSVKEDYIIRNASRWWQHPHALPLDVGLAAYVEYQRTLSRSLDFLYSNAQAANGLQTDCDYLLVIKTFESQLVSWMEEWSFHTTDAAARGILDRVVEYRGLIAQFYFHYANLVLNSFGLQNALEKSPTDLPHFFGRCHSHAITCAKIVKEGLIPKGYMRYGPDSHFVLFSYALLTLLKLIRTEFKTFIENENDILGMVSSVADLFEEIAVNQYHTPSLYSTFLRALVSSKSAHTQPGSPAMSPSHQDAPMDNGDAPHDATNPHFQHEPPGPGAGNQSESSHASQNNPFNSYNAFHNFSGEMGQTQVQDISTFPPTYAAPTDPNEYGLFSMDNILGDGFWDSVLIPGYSNSFEGLSGGFVYGAGGSGFITPKRTTPVVSGANSPLRMTNGQFTQSNLNAAFGSQ